MSLRARALCCGCALALASPSALAQHGHHGAPDSSAQMMSALMVRAAQEQILLRSGRSIIDPKAIAASTGSIADLLRSVPGLEVDAGGTLRLRGDAQVLVMINGRRTALTGQALGAYLRQMPAQSLERVEAVTAPSAKDDANGAAGLLNLVFRDAEDAEHTSPLRSLTGQYASLGDYSATAAATGHAGHFVHWDAAYATSASRQRTRADASRWTALPGDLPFTTEEDARAEATHRLHSVIAGAAVTPTAATSLGLRGTYSWMQGVTATRSFADYRDDAGNSASTATASLREHVMPTAELIGTARVERGRMRLETELRASALREEHRGAYDDLGGGYRYLTATMNARQRERVLRNDLRLRWLGTELELGQESRLRRTTAVHEAAHFGAQETRVFQHETAVHAGFASAARTVGALRWELGVRLERERDSRTLESAWARKALRVFPSLRGEWTDANRGLVLRVAYGRRVTRPSWEMLNPLSMGDERFGEFSGNAALRPEMVDQVELGLERLGTRTVVHATPFLRWSQDPIRAISALTSRGVSRTLTNLAWARSAGFDLGLRAQATERVDVTLAGTLARETMAGGAQRRDGPFASLRVALDVRVSELISAQLLVAGRSRRTVAQGEALPEASGEFALKRSIARGRGALTLQLRSPWRVSGQRLGDPGVFTDRMWQFNSRPRLGIFASFGVGGQAIR